MGSQSFFLVVSIFAVFGCAGWLNSVKEKNRDTSNGEYFDEMGATLGLVFSIIALVLSVFYFGVSLPH